MDTLFLVKKLSFLFFLIVGTISPILSQKGNVWVFSDGYGLDFQTPNPSFSGGFQSSYSSSGAYSISHRFVSICDSSGALLFYSDGRQIWNGQDSVIINGEISTESQIKTPLLLIQQPNTEKYFLFTGGNGEVLYTIIDRKSHPDSSIIIVKNKVLVETSHGNITAKKTCKNSVIWLVVDADLNGYGRGRDTTDQLYSFRLDQQGLDTIPVVNKPTQIANFIVGTHGHLAFSPTKDKLLFSVVHSSLANGLYIADFDVITGKISNLVNTKLIATSDIAFSPSGKYIYGGFYLTQTYSFRQYDISSGNSQVIQSTGQYLFSAGNAAYFPKNTPDKNIWVFYFEEDPTIGQYSYLNIAKIIFPDLPHPQSQFVPATGPVTPLFTYSLGFPPEFPSYYWTPDSLKSIHFSAGPDKFVCPDEIIEIGQDTCSSAIYSWNPGSYLGNTQTAMVNFLYPGPQSDSLVLAYELQVNTPDGCILRDSVMVTVLPEPMIPKIHGSYSVCPGVDSVWYWIDSIQAGTSIRWFVQGGNIVTGQGLDSVRISWGAASQNAWVHVRIQNDETLCESSSPRYPVGVQLILNTQKPQGEDSICVENRLSQPYSITSTNGSVYTWGVKGGIISSGQGTSNIMIDWIGAGLHKIWVQELSDTRDTICYGTSDTLTVLVVDDKTDFIIEHISISENSDKNMAITLGFTPGFWPIDSSWFARQDLFGGIAFQSIQSPDNWVDSSINGDFSSYSYQGFLSHPCKSFNTQIHRSIFLQGKADTTTNEIQLQWTSYEGKGVSRYELWRQLDNNPYSLIANLSPTTFDTTLSSGLEGFDHSLRIRAVDMTGNQFSQSNDTSFIFSHAIHIPNVFTPNGDGIHDTWMIENLSLFPLNEVRIYDRWGRRIFSRTGYQNDWNAQNVEEGVYFYAVKILPTEKMYRGSLTILR